MVNYQNIQIRDMREKAIENRQKKQLNETEQFALNQIVDEPFERGNVSNEEDKYL